MSNTECIKYYGVEIVFFISNILLKSFINYNRKRYHLCLIIVVTFTYKFHSLNVTITVGQR